ncbi:C40 family peptidase [Paenibacillus sp. FSL H8-0034]|uniref:C40 family peptidase n=1 Tax=Paenibacillus sp. FSL H8-0034 TaxID=2954671 RepID=UPI0030F69068
MKRFVISTMLAGSLLFGGIASASAASANPYLATDSDTFWSISQKLNMNVSDLIAANPQIDPQNVHAGVSINLPGTQAKGWEAQADAIIATGMKQLGTPYVFGGDTPYVAFDCSGFVQYAFNENGFDLLHSSSLLSEMGTPVDKGDLRKGDLVFLQGTYTSGVSHVAIYLGNNQVLQAGTMGTREVKISTFFGTPYYDEHYWGARRLIN